MKGVCAFLFLAWTGFLTPSIVLAGVLQESVAQMMSADYPVMLVTCDSVQKVEAGWVARCHRLGGTIQTPTPFSLHYYGPNRDDLEQNQPTVISIFEVDAAIHLRAQTPIGLTIPREDLPAVRRLLSAWPQSSESSTVAQLDRAIGLLRDSSAPGRRLGVEYLSERRQEFRQYVDVQRVDAMGQILLDPGWPIDHQKAVALQMPRLGGDAASAWFKKHFFNDLPRHLLTSAILALGRTTDPIGQAVIRRCARQRTGLVQRLCQHRVRGDVPPSPNRRTPAKDGPRRR